MDRCDLGGNFNLGAPIDLAIPMGSAEDAGAAATVLAGAEAGEAA